MHFEKSQIGELHVPLNSPRAVYNVICKKWRSVELSFVLDNLCLEFNILNDRNRLKCDNTVSCLENVCYVLMFDDFHIDSSLLT